VLAGTLGLKSAGFASSEQLTNSDACDLAGEVQAEEARKGDFGGSPWTFGDRNDYSW
jgi:hypothetical protein